MKQSHVRFLSSCLVDNRMSLSLPDNEIIQQILKIVEDAIKLGVEYLPAAEKLLLGIWQSLYSPKQIFHNLALIASIQTLVVAFQTLHGFSSNIIMEYTEKGRKEKALLKDLSRSKSYAEWQSTAFKLDQLHGLDVWRNVDESAFYDSHTIAKRISGVVEMLDKADMFNLMFRLRGGLARDQFGIMHSGLFTRAMSGTKKIIEKYHDTVASALNFICDSPDDEVSCRSPYR